VGNSSATASSRRLAGLLVRRECWTLSWFGKLLVSVFLILSAWLLLHGLYPFLSVNDGGAGDVLVVEGWISTHRIEQAAQAFAQGHYQRVIVVRNANREGDKWESGRYTADYLAADLVEHGVPKELIQVLFCPVVKKDRSYTCAVAVREWLARSALAIKGLDVVTMAVHTRRSRLLYRKAFGSSVQIGAIALEDREFDPGHWWRSSEGIREVPSEALAYLYARLFFFPAAPSP
jgi:hypothetical protein